MINLEEVNENKEKSKVYFIVFSKIKQGKSLKDICKDLTMSKQALNRYISKLKANGSIEKLGYGVWKTNEFIDKQVNKIEVGKMKTLKKVYFSEKDKEKDNRGHAFRFKIKIPKIDNWMNREKFMIKNNIQFQKINKGHTHRIIFRGCKTWINKESIIVYFPKGRSFFGESADESEKAAVLDMIEIMKGLDNLFKTSFKINKFYQIRVFGKHHANIKNGLAKIYNDEGRKISISNEDGQWLLIDDSFGLDEMETVGNKGKNNATKDMDQVIRPFFNSLKENPFTAYDFKNLFDVVNQIASRNFDASVNIEKITETLEDIKQELRRR